MTIEFSGGPDKHGIPAPTIFIPWSTGCTNFYGRTLQIGNQCRCIFNTQRGWIPPNDYFIIWPNHNIAMKATLIFSGVRFIAFLTMENRKG